MAWVKKSIYLDADLEEPLKAAAERDSRSVNRQINVLLRGALDRAPRVAVADPWGPDRPARPDPKPKPSSKKLK